MSQINDRFKDAPWISDQQVVVGGAGGIGSWLTLFLSRIGYSVHLYDFDMFEQHNLGGQFVNTINVGIRKVHAISQLCSDFGGKSVNTYSEEFTENSTSHTYMFSAFDNMRARRIMFDSWFEYNKSYENINSIFIDGRLLFEQMQIFCVTPMTTKIYREKHLFDDSEVPDEVCTLKQTSHSAAMIASLMTGFFTNHITNVLTGKKARKVPFNTEYFIPLNMFTDGNE